MKKTKGPLVRWIGSATDLKGAQMFELSDDWKWPGLMGRIGLEADDTVFAVSKDEWYRNKRNCAGFAMSTEDDLQNLLLRCKQQTKWRQVVLYDSSDQWVNDPDESGISHEEVPAAK